jgi:acyl-CoA thioesterase-1
MGDSLTEGLGVDQQDAYPAQLERKLQADGYKVKVINAGVSGETSSGALARLDWVLKLKPQIVLLATGGNDSLRGIDPTLTQANLQQLVQKLQAQQITVVLAGMQTAQNLGAEYTQAFAAIYPAVAQANQVILIPFFLAGVAGDPKLNQRDFIHPTAAGYTVVVQTIYPYVLEALKAVEHKGGS